jgi:hypothetical protein
LVDLFDFLCWIAIVFCENKNLYMLYDMKSYEQFWEELVPAYPVTK